ncbi:MAG: CRTAC1 family protein [Pyrinomonadaceae bacterium]|nr:CRTAC1 family protein [Pyrinomonadaceae bacterium]
MKFLSLALVLCLPGIAIGQAAGGVSTGEAKVYASKRTTGIVSDTAPVVFDDVTGQSSLSSFSCVSGGKAKEYIVETTACTVAVLDFDNDGLQDIYLVNGSTIDALRGKTKHPSSSLYRNLGDWKFEDVTKKAGLENNRWGMGVAVGDYNNDGYADIFVSNYGVSRLYKNNGDGTFADVAEAVGLAIEGWHTGATFGDFDKDGRLDIFVPAYVEFTLEDLPMSPLKVDKESRGSSYCQFRGEPVMCGPRGLKGAGDLLFRQTDDGKFEEVGKKLGVDDDGNYYGFSSVFVDIDDDRDLDLLVVNDSTPKQLYLNDGGKFEEFGYPSGIALNENGREQAGMGLAVGDYDNDGLVDFHITNFSDDSNTLYRNDSDSNFTDVTFQAGIGEPSVPFLGWGTSFFDFDNDGWKDVIVANGHVYPVVDNFDWGTSYKQQLLLFRNIGADSKGKVGFEAVGAAKDSGLAGSNVARGLAIADFDNDGKLDVITNNIDSAPSLLRNVSASKGNWLSVRLIGSGKSPRDAVGSVVYLTAGKLRQRMDVVSGAGYASQNQMPLNFGIGNASSIDGLTVFWSDGTEEEFKVEKINTQIVLLQGKGLAAQKAESK